MTTTICALYDHPSAAAAAVEDLKVIGLMDSDISVLSPGMVSPETAGLGGDSDMLADAGTGAALGGALGGAGGLLAGIGLVTIPGVGPILAAGWLASTAVGAAAGAAVGGAAGGIIGALTADGVAEDDAHVYAEAVRRGGTLVVARVPNLRLEAARTALDAHKVDVLRRRSDYQAEGWTGFDDQAPRHEPRDEPRERNMS